MLLHLPFGSILLKKPGLGVRAPLVSLAPDCPPPLSHDDEFIVQSVKYMSKNTSRRNHTSDVMIITCNYDIRVI